MSLFIVSVEDGVMSIRQIDGGDLKDVDYKGAIFQTELSSVDPVERLADYGGIGYILIEGEIIAYVNPEGLGSGVCLNIMEAIGDKQDERE